MNASSMVIMTFRLKVCEQAVPAFNRVNEVDADRSIEYIEITSRFEIDLYPCFELYYK